MSRSPQPRARLVRWSAVAIVCLIALGLAASAWTSHSAPATSRPLLRIWYGTDDPTERAWAQALARRFAAQHPSVQVRLTVYDLDQINDKMQLALNGGDPPDLVYTTPRGPGLPAYVRAGKLRDLSADAAHRGWATRLRPGLLAAYNGLLAPGNRQRIYAVPSELAAVAVLYNKGLFHRLHLAIPRTLSEFERTVARVKAAGLTPLGFGNADGWVGDDWWLTLVNATVGPAALQPELELSPSFSFRGPAFRQAAQTLQTWAGQGMFTPQFGGLDAQDSVDAFFDGHTAMQLISSTQNSQILTLARQTHLDVGVFPFPSGQTGQPPVMPQSGYAGWAIPRAAHEPAAALDFIDHVTSLDTAQLLVAHGMLPARQLDPRATRLAAPFQRDYMDALASAAAGVYLDSAPIPNLNATMEANIQLLLQNVEAPDYLTRSLQDVYSSRGVKASSTRTDGEF